MTVRPASCVTVLFATVLGATISAGGAESALTRVSVVENGMPTGNARTTGDWRAGETGFRGSGLNSTVEATQVVGPGDFTIVARLKVDHRNAVRCGLVIDDVSDFCLATPQNPLLYVRGFLFGDITQEIPSARDLISPNTPFELRAERRGDMMRFAVDGRELYKLPYENQRALGKIALRAGQANLQIAEFFFEGTTEKLLEGRRSPHDLSHELRPRSSDVFVSGAGGYHTYRIPAMVVSNQGTILAFAEGRKNSAADHGDVDLVLRRSEDGGRSWAPMQLVYEEGDKALITIGNPVPVVDRKTGTIWLLFCRDNERVFVGRSTDDGKTWSARREITEQVKDPAWGHRIFTGPVHGLQLDDGRLLVPSYHANKGGGTSSFMIYSDDAGLTWRRGKSMAPDTGEPTAALLSTGQVMMNSRTPTCTWNRAVAVSDDRGMTWGPVRLQKELLDLACQGTLLDRVSSKEPRLLLFSNPNSHRRERMTVQLSVDDGLSWTSELRIYEGSSAYSDMARTPDGRFAVLFERDFYKKITFTPFELRDFPSETHR